MSQTAKASRTKTKDGVARRKLAQQERSQQRVEHILSTTLSMLSEGPAEDVTTRKIAARAQVSVGSIYQFFPNKEALYYELFKRWLTQTLAALDSLIAQIPEESGPDDVETHVEAFLQTMSAPKLNSPANWRLRLAMSSSHKLTELENRHRLEIAQRLLKMRSRFGKLPPPSIAQELFLLQNEVTIACLYTLSRTQPANRAPIQDLCTSLVLRVFAFDGWAE
ncbi:MAG: TetR/AcrR family transcriptional regulator [Shimia sp.]|nr:TetR/AcrR family transcriptional regulator [Shimia sp.]